MPNELQGILALLVITAPLMVYGVYLKRQSNRLGRLIEEERAAEARRIVDPR
ncbi:hypothetical protein ABIC32_000787 [Brevundimonas sp. 1080]|uniref:hypothetical protein n=1 Tax=Brevundimonas sp. 1080 TaxID=3156405 RepID=UPI003398A99A